VFVSEAGAELNYDWLQFLVELTNLMQTISFSTNYVVYALLNVRFRHALEDVVCCRLAVTAEPTTPRDQHQLVQLDADYSSRRRRHSDCVSRQHANIELKTTVHHTTSI